MKFKFDTIQCSWIKLDSNQVGLNNITESISSVSIFPNPTNNILIIETQNMDALENYYYKIVDLNGKEIFSTQVKNLHTEIYMNSFASKGVYILNMTDANGKSIEMKKIILE